MQVKKFKFKPLAPFKNYEEEANFWDTHDVTDFWDPKTIVRTKNGLMAAIDPKKVKKVAMMSIRLQPSLQRRLEEVASSKGLNVSTLARMWLMEKAQAVGVSVAGEPFLPEVPKIVSFLRVKAVPRFEDLRVILEN